MLLKLDSSRKSYVPGFDILDIVTCFVYIWQACKHFLTCCIPFPTEAFKSLSILYLKYI